MSEVLERKRPDFWEGTFERPKWPSFISHSLIIRYLLVERGSHQFTFSAQVIQAIPATQRDPFQYLLLDYSYDPMHPSKSGVRRVNTNVEGKSYTENDFMGFILDWMQNANGYPWYEPWLEREPFVGVYVKSEHPLRLENPIFRTLPASSARFMPFHGAIAAAFGAQFRNMQRTTWTENVRGQVDRLERLVKQFDAFCAQVQEDSLIQLASV